MYCGTRLLTFKRISTLSLTTSGRTFKLCGAIGVMTKFSLFGVMIGPPQLKEYAVEPVGVETVPYTHLDVYKRQLIPSV